MSLSEVLVSEPKLVSLGECLSEVLVSGGGGLLTVRAGEGGEGVLRP